MPRVSSNNAESRQRRTSRVAIHGTENPESQIERLVLPTVFSQCSDNGGASQPTTFTPTPPRIREEFLSVPSLRVGQPVPQSREPQENFGESEVRPNGLGSMLEAVQNSLYVSPITGQLTYSDNTANSTSVPPTIVEQTHRLRTAMNMSVSRTPESVTPGAVTFGEARSDFGPITLSVEENDIDDDARSDEEHDYSSCSSDQPYFRARRAHPQHIDEINFAEISPPPRKKVYHDFEGKEFGEELLNLRKIFESYTADVKMKAIKEYDMMLQQFRKSVYVDL